LFTAAKAALIGATLIASAASAAGPSLEDYRHFRALSIDLNGRMPSRAEVAAFEAPGFDLSAWIDAHLGGTAYVERLTRVYTDLLRLQVGPSFQFVPSPTTLRRVQVMGPDGAPVTIYFRQGQRRVRPETDAAFCLDQAETGLQFPSNTNPTGTPTPVPQATLDQFTTLVYPWWLYNDYKAATPSDRYSTDWQTTHPGFTPVDALVNDTRLTDAGTDAGSTPVLTVRVCNEEAQTAQTGTIYASGRTSNPPPIPYGRLNFPPTDSAYAKLHKGEAIDCSIGSGYSMSVDCGCGPGLERCLPGSSSGFDPAAFNFTSQQPLGYEQAVDANSQSGSSWTRVWWGEEATRFLGDILEGDRDFREVLTGHQRLINGPLTQFYKAVAPVTCCGQGLAFGLTKPEPLFDPATIKQNLQPNDVTHWERIADAGPRASGLLTMPVFLTKFGSRRARAHALYNAFLCRDFVAQNVQLQPSVEPNLMIRPGCQTCHVRLEPMAAYFTRVQESDWTYLPAEKLPLTSATCRNKADGGTPSTACNTYYDPAFSGADGGMMRGAYGSPAHAELGPAGLAQDLVADEQFPTCVAQNVASAFLGRALTVEDVVLKQQLADAFTGSGYKMSALVKALVTSASYARANNVGSASLTGGTP